MPFDFVPIRFDPFPDQTTAVMWMRRAADGGDAGVQFNLSNRCNRAGMKITETTAAQAWAAASGHLVDRVRFSSR